MKDLLKAYKKDGFCVAKKLLPEALPLAVLKEVDALCQQQLKRLKLTAVPFKDEHSLHANMKTLLKGNLDAYLGFARHIGKLLSVQELVSHTKISEITKELGIAFPSIPTAPVVNIMSDELKIPGGYFGVKPHQDWPSIQGSLDAITLWTPLMNVTETNFPLEMIPGSHLKGLWEGVDSAYAREIPEDAFRDSDFVPVKVERGDVIFFSVFTVHRTGLKHEAKDCYGLRIGCNFRYENSAESTFTERNYYCAYKRSVERELVTPNFPKQDQVRKFFN